MDMQHIAAISISRCNRWHKNGIMDWDLNKWAVALAGEVGEACNIIKKMNRVEDGIQRKPVTMQELQEKLAEELADSFLYLQLLSLRANINLQDAVIKKFNKVSEEYGFPERL